MFLIIERIKRNENNQLFLYSVLADSTLKRMTKAELIKRIRCLENERKDLIARIVEAKDEAVNANKALLKALYLLMTLQKSVHFYLLL